MKKTRIQTFRELLNQKQLPAFLITKNENIKYLTGFDASDAYLLVFQKSAYYITDFRYILEAKAGVKCAQIVEFKRSMFQSVYELLKKNKIKKIGVDNRHLSLADFRKLREVLPLGIKIIETQNIVESLRELKDQNEIQAIRNALAVHQKALRYIKKYIKPGVSELDILEKLKGFISRENVGFSFSPIVASGPNSCLPHAKVSRRKIGSNDVVLLDMGFDLNGYKSDLTRMFFLGKIPQLVREVNDLVLQAQRRAIENIKPGVSIADIDFSARSFLEKHKLSKYFGHALGHGVGLEIHENPRIFQQNPSLLKEGMVITIEPAVYLPNKFGIRIEDMVLVTKNGCEVLSDNIN